MSISVAEAGRRGGLSLLRQRGREYYSQIGQKGQKATREKFPNMAREWGRRGGRPKKTNLDDLGK